MRSKIIILLLFVVLFGSQDLFAQCAMCKAVVESGAHADSEVVEGVNNGILYMMGVPYLLMMVIGFAWYKKYYKPSKEDI